MRFPYKMIVGFITVLLFTLCGCRNSGEPQAQQRDEANTPAGKAGKAAHEVVKDAGKAAKTVGRELGKAAHQAREGWKEAAQEDRDRKQGK